MANHKIVNMRAIEYNMLKTILQLLVDRIPTVAQEYGIKHTNIQIAPTYPSDLTKIKKPSIIVRKVSTEQHKVGLGNIAGHYYNEDNAWVDVLGKFHCTMIQFDVVTANNTDRELLKSVVADGILNEIQMNELNAIGLHDYTQDKNPEVGIVKLIHDPIITDLTDINPTDSMYVGVVRQMFKVIQTIVPNYEYVDLTKWIKQTYTISLQ